MKKNLLTVLMLAGILFSPSCTKDDVVAPTLQLSETGIIILPKAASEKAITVTTNQAEWTSMANVDWIELIQSGTTLTIKAEENYSSVIRKAEVMVLAGGLGKKLTVEQSESDLTVVTIPDKLEVNQWGGTFQFDVDANTDDWNVVSDAEWLKVTSKQFKKEVILEIEENTERKDRTAVLAISSGGNTLKEFTVVQNGIMYFIFPYLKAEASMGEIIAFEEARKSIFTPDWTSIYYDLLVFETKSTAFPVIKYEYYDNAMRQVEMNASSNEFIEDPEFKKMMEDEGFERPSEFLYVKESSQGESKYIIEAAIVKGEDGDESGIIFTFKPVQPGSMPTFEEMPYGFKNFGAPDGSLDNVFDWEEENGGVYVEEESDLDNGFYWFNAPSPWINRAYFIDDNYVAETAGFFSDIQKFYYEAGGNYYMTEEFTKLKDKEGFTDLLLTWSGFEIYGSPDTQYEMAIGVFNYADVNEGKPVVNMHFYLADNTDGGSISRKWHKDRISMDKGENSLSNKAIRIKK